MPRFRSINASVLTNLTVLIATLPAYANIDPADFSQLDTNVDAVIDFAEFSAFAKSQGQTRTQAAQTFISLTNGDALITEKEYRLGADLLDNPAQARSYALPTLEGEVETVDTVTLQGQIIEVTPNEEIAGEVIRAFEDDRQNDGRDNDII